MSVDTGWRLGAFWPQGTRLGKTAATPSESGGGQLSGSEWQV